MDFTIKREKWIRGREGTLLLENGCGCVLGHVCVQLGVSTEALLGRCLPGSVARSSPEARLAMQPILDEDGLLSDWASVAMDLNDAPRINDGPRERRIAKEFRRAGHTLTFVD